MNKGAVIILNLKMKSKPPEQVFYIAMVLLLSLTVILLPKCTRIAEYDWKERHYNISQGVYLSGNPIVYLVKSRVLATLTAYNSVPEQTDSTPFITASGQRTRDGIVAANWLKMGTIIRIDGEYYQVQDRMNKRYGFPYVDIWMEGVDDAKEFGRQNKLIEIIK